MTWEQVVLAYVYLLGGTIASGFVIIALDRVADAIRDKRRGTK